MYGGFSEESLTEFIKLTYGDEAENFSEEDFFSFTRCVRPNGSTYGTAGKCKKGTETGAKEVTPSSSRTRPKAAIESDMTRLTSSGAMQQAGLAGIKARAKHAALKAELKKPLKDNVIGNPTPAQRAAMENKIALTRNKKGETKSPADLATPQKQGQADVDRIRNYAKDEAAKLKALNDAQKQNSNNANDPPVASRKKILERNVAAAEKQLKELEGK